MENTKIKRLGVMIDCSRNAVMTAEECKKFAGLLSKMGYNTLLLYMEDTYTIDGQPLFGYMRGRYSKAELKEIDGYCASLGIEVIPCIQTLAHLNGMFRWQEYDKVRDCADILLVGDENTYELIEQMIRSVSECFRSKKVHLGMDEAWLLGSGQYLSKNGFSDKAEILKKHLRRVCGIAEKYGIEPLVWHDMFFNHREELAGELPETAELVYWDYYHTDYDHYVRRITQTKSLSKSVWFAGGAWSWLGFAPDNTFSIETMIPAVKACFDTGVENVFFTMWGDDGGECSRCALLPSLFYAAELVRGNTDETLIKSRFREIIGADYDSFMLLDELNRIDGTHKEHTAKYLLFNDPLLGPADWRITMTEGEYYAALAEKLANADIAEEYSYIFDSMKALCDVLALKAELGVKLRSAYKKGDKTGLAALAEVCTEIISRLNRFHRMFRTQWLRENKPFGLEVQDIRIGGLIRRIEVCRDLVSDYAAGKTDSIPELEEDIIKSECAAMWLQSASPNVMTMFL